MRITKIKWNTSLIICIFLFICISITSIYSAQTYLSESLGNLSIKQLFWYLTGIIIILLTIKIGHIKIYKYSTFLYIIGNILLLLLLLFATPINNSKCWFIIPGIGSFQPSEFMKIFLILIVSNNINKSIKNKKKLSTVDEVNIIIKTISLVLIPSVLTFLEPDTGVVLIYFVICLSILLISTIRKRWFIVSFVIISLLLGMFLYLYFWDQNTFVNFFGTDLFYRIDRLLDWKNGTGMQLENSLTSIATSNIIVRD